MLEVQYNAQIQPAAQPAAQPSAQPSARLAGQNFVRRSVLVLIEAIKKSWIFFSGILRPLILRETEGRLA
jgi:hypothetical protein